MDFVANRCGKFISLVLLTVASLLLTGCVQVVAAPFSGGAYGYPSLSPGNQTIVLHYCRRGSRCQIVLYDLVTETLKAIKNPPNTSRLSPYYSPAGRRIVFIEARLNSSHSQIVLMDLESGQVRTITRSHTAKYSPAISPDGERVLFVEAGKITKKEPHEFDLHEIEVASGKRRQVTNLKAMGFVPPYYISKDGDILTQTGGYLVYRRDSNLGTRVFEPDARESRQNALSKGRDFVYLVASFGAIAITRT